MDTQAFSADVLVKVATDLVLTWGLKILGAVAVLVIGRIAGGMARSSVRKILQRTHVDTTLVPFCASMAYYLVMIFVLVAVLGLFGIPTASIIAVMGAAGLAVGLALQGTLSNFGAGVMLLLFRPIRAGDFVEAAGVAGSVMEIGLFATVLNTGDNVRITLPNATIFGQTIKNYSANDTRRIDLTVGIGYDDSIATAMETISAVMAGDRRILADPAPVVAVGELADSSVNLVVRPWCRKEDYWGVRWDLTRAFKERLEAAGCSIPYPQQDVHIHQPGAGPVV
ncbi:MAG: mechanosensitive ion channel family protein [Acidobacteriota bacterium]